MSVDLASINWLAVIVATVIYFARSRVVRAADADREGVGVGELL